MKPFWDALQEYRALKPANTKIRKLGPADRREIERIQGPRPKKHCRYCCGPCPAKRRNWCSNECVNNYLIAAGVHEAVKQAVKQRDKEVCSLCGLDTVRLLEDFWRTDTSQALLRLRTLSGHVPYEITDGPEAGTLKSISDLSIWLTSYEIWEIDHVVPVSEGGGIGHSEGIQNLRTCCMPCHRHLTKKLATKRKNEKPKRNKQ